MSAGRQAIVSDFPQFLLASFVTVFVIDIDGVLLHLSITNHRTFLLLIDLRDCGIENVDFSGTLIQLN
jgi:hypothetical protein